MNDLILYTTEDGKSQIRLRADLGTVWLTQLEMAELFQTTKQNIAKHLKAIFVEQELSQESVVNQRLTTAADGKNYRVAHYNLDAILAVGYRVRSPRGVQFRRWASTVLKEFLTKGFVMDDDPLGDCRPTARGHGCGRFPRLHAVFPVPLPVRQLRGSGQKGVGQRLPRYRG
jgi:hypothetical protein